VQKPLSRAELAPEFDRGAAPPTTSAPVWPIRAPFVAWCVDAHHPTLLGRVKVALQHSHPKPDAPGDELWLPALQGLSVRAGDRVLVQHALGSPEPIVVGIIDGFLPRPEPETLTGARLELAPDETLLVHTREGQRLLEITPSLAGYLVRLLSAEARLDVSGKLSISAAELELEATRGSVRIEASDHVCVVGETVRLN
jgi:hypothetical protein